jgi:hypothetical protein
LKTKFWMKMILSGRSAPGISGRKKEYREI